MNDEERMAALDNEIARKELRLALVRGDITWAEYRERVAPYTDDEPDPEMSPEMERELTGPSPHWLVRYPAVTLMVIALVVVIIWLVRGQ